ncbi:MAG TPA: acetate--CoA ligase family protein [Chloroflexota bacterium]|nr:acetate--CoA ligase family protein [Chloroflexota bacterium]
MQPLMNPRSVGVIGASERSPRGARALRNLVTIGFEGEIYPINPKYDEVLGLRCYPSTAATPKPADLVIVAIPAAQVTSVLEEAHEAGVKAALVLAAGFGEAGEEGRERHEALTRLAARGMLICGPNCYGVLNMHARSGSWGGELPNPFLAGNVALVSQSGGTCALITNPLARQRKVGFSFVVSCGNQAGVGIEDYLDYLVDDPNTQVISAFVEGFREPRRLPGIAARAAAQRKPIVLLKVGHSEEARANALTHTGSLAGDAEIMDALLAQHGIIQVFSLDELNETTALLSLAKDKRAGWRVGVLSGSGGECGRVSDAAQGTGMRFPRLSPETAQAIETILPEYASPANPMDGTGAVFDYPEAFPRVAEALLADDALDVLAFNLTALPPYGSGRAPHRGFAKLLADIVLARKEERLVAAYGSITLGVLDGDTIDMLRGAGMPYLESPEKALRALANLARWQEFLPRTPRRERDGASEPGAPAFPLLSKREQGRLGFMEARELLVSFGVPVVETRLCASEDEAVRAAQGFGYPVALKIESPDIAHKTEAGGVKLGCVDEVGVREAHSSILASVPPDCRIDGVLVQPMAAEGVETILGIKYDPLVGPALVFGLGGIYAEVLRDVALRIPPVDAAEAERMVAQLRGVALLRGARGRAPADTKALVRAILAVSELAVATDGRLRALDLNPLMVFPEGQGVLAVDALLELG